MSLTPKGPRTRHPKGVALPRLFAAGLWLVVTVASTAVVWAATSIVAADVMERPVSVIAHRDVVSELKSGSSAANPTSISTAPATNGSTSTTPSPDGRSVPGSPPAPVPTAPMSPAPKPVPGSQASQPGAPSPLSPQPGVAAAPSSPFISVTTAPSASPSNHPESPPITQPPYSPAVTYSTSGGAVRVACSGSSINLISAIPSNGYAVNVVADGPANVDVRFMGSGPEQSVQAGCLSGQPFRYSGHGPPGRGPGRS